MVTSSVILSLLSTVIGYGFPSGNGFEPGAIHVGLSPASAIPNITMSRDCVKSAVTALHFAFKVCATAAPSASSRAPSYFKYTIKSEKRPELSWAHLACMARNLGCYSKSRVSQARVVATSAFIKLPMAYVLASTIRELSRWLANVSATCDLVGRSRCHACMTTMVASFPARARLSHFRPWQRFLLFVIRPIDYFIVRMLMRVAPTIATMIHNMSVAQCCR